MDNKQAAENKELSIQDGNRIIATFMGLTTNTNERGFVIITDEDGDPPFDYPKYHSSWDWLMPVWKRLFPILAIISTADNSHYHTIKMAIGRGNIENAYPAIVRAIIFINSKDKI
jgi:hypothetical protein